jgi:phosphonate utilization transcriptional regulator
MSTPNQNASALAPNALEILQSQSLPMLVQKEIERMIVGGELAAGAKLSENTLALKLGVSRGPVREALRGLEQTGLVQLEKNRGVFVRQIAVEEAAEIFELRATFDQLAGRKLAEHIEPARLKELTALIERMEKASARDDADAYHPLNLRFHDALIEFAGNRKMLHTYRRLVNELNLFRRHTLAQRDRLPASTREHRQIVEAIAARKPELAGQLLHDHVMASSARMRATHAQSADVVALARPKPLTHRKTK